MGQISRNDIDIEKQSNATLQKNVLCSQLLLANYNRDGVLDFYM